jgi:hypothetical protein
MASIPTINSNLATELNDLEIAANQLFGVVRMCRAHACMLTSTLQNNKNSGYVKNLNLIIDVSSKINDGVNCYRVERGVVLMGLLFSTIAPTSIDTLTKQLTVLSSLSQDVRSQAQQVQTRAITATDASAVKLAGVINEIMDQLIYLIAIMDSQRNSAGTGLGIPVFSELVADNVGIRGLDQLPRWE